MAQGISLREFARRDGCSDTLVRKAIKGGYLRPFGDGSLDPALVGTGWRRGNKDANHKCEPIANPAPVNREVQEGLENGLDAFMARVLRGEFATKADAEAVKENALALKQVLAVRREANEIVDMEIAERALFEGARAIRDAWLNWPSRVGPVMAADLGLAPDKVVEVLTKHVHEHLADLGESQAEFGKKV